MMGVPPPRGPLCRGKSSLPGPQPFLCCCLGLGAGVDQFCNSAPPNSGGVEPIGALWVLTVVAADDDDDVDDMDDDELDRGRIVFLRASIALTSSGFIEFIELIELRPCAPPAHGRDIGEKFGGFATAVIETTGGGFVACLPDIYGSPQGCKRRFGLGAARSQGQRRPVGSGCDCGW
jgi:hypothetical protein